MSFLGEAFKIIKKVWNRELINLQEQLMAFYFNHSNKLIGCRLISTGTMNACMADIKLLISLASHCMATTVIIAHNHPCGSLKPSQQDIELTKKIKNALALIDIKLLDHLIICEDGFLSLTDEGFIV